MGVKKTSAWPAGRLRLRRVRTRCWSLTRARATVAAGFLVAVCAPAIAADKGSIAVMPFKLLDTSAEPTDQQSDHERRLKAMALAMARELTETGTFSGAAIVGATEISSACPTETAHCLLGLTRSKGAAFALFGVLHKSSTLIMQLFLTIVAVDDRTVLMSRDLNFRGDNDQSWSRAKDFLIDQIRREIGSPGKSPVAASPPR